MIIKEGVCSDEEKDEVEFSHLVDKRFRSLNSASAWSQWSASIKTWSENSFDKESKWMQWLLADFIINDYKLSDWLADSNCVSMGNNILSKIIKLCNWSVLWLVILLLYPYTFKVGAWRAIFMKW